MNKTLCKIISAAVLGASLGVIGTTASLSTPVSASIQEEGLKNQNIYREGDYVIAVERASYYALIQNVWIEFNHETAIEHENGYAAPNSVGTKEYADGTTVTVKESEDGDGYIITYKMPIKLFPYINETRASFVLERTGGGSIYPYYRDDNNGHGYQL